MTTKQRIQTTIAAVLAGGAISAGAFAATRPSQPSSPQPAQVLATTTVDDSPTTVSVPDDSITTPTTPTTPTQTTRTSDDDEPGHTRRGRGTDDGPNHDADDDHGRNRGSDDHGRNRGSDDRGSDDDGDDDGGRHGGDDD